MARATPPPLAPEPPVHRLADELTACTTHVTQLADHIGDPQLTGDQLVRDLHAAISAALAASVAHVDTARASWQAKLDAVCLEGEQLARATGCPAPAPAAGCDPAPAMTLKQQYDAAVAAISGLRQEHAARRKEEQDLLAQLTELECDLAPFVQIPPAPVSPENSSVAPLPRSYLDALRSEVARGSAELHVRSQTLQETLEDIVDLWSTIHTPPRPAQWFDAMVCTHLQLRPVYVVRHGQDGRPAGYQFLGEFDRFLNDQGRFDVFAPPDAVPASIAGGPAPLPARLTPTAEHLARASALYDVLLTTKTEREARIQDVYDELSALWMEFDVPQDEMEAFVQDNSGSTLIAVQRYEEELAKMKELKREHMALFIEKGWERILRLCDRARITEEECRARFPLPVYGGQLEGPEGGEAILAQLEEILTVLSEETDKKLALLDTVTKYQQVLQEEKEMEERARDPNRFKNTRGGAMLKEEKMRKRVKILKPKLETELLRDIPAWESQYGQVFTIDGAPYLATLEATRALQQEEATASKRTRTASAALMPSARPGTAMGRPGTAMGRPGTAMGTRTVPGTPTSRSASPTRIGSVAIGSAAKRPRMATGASMVGGTPQVARAVGARPHVLRAALDSPSPAAFGAHTRNYTASSASASSAASSLTSWPHGRTGSVSSATTHASSHAAAPVPAPAARSFKPRPSVKLETYERRGGRRSGLPPREERDAMRWADEALDEELDEDAAREPDEERGPSVYGASRSRPGHGTLAPVQPLAGDPSAQHQSRTCSVMSSMSNATIITHPLPAPSDGLRLAHPASPGGKLPRSALPVPTRSRPGSPVRSPRPRA